MSAERRRGLTWHCSAAVLTPYSRQLETEQFEGGSSLGFTKWKESQENIAELQAKEDRLSNT
jgi:hypothetical protein